MVFVLKLTLDVLHQLIKTSPFNVKEIKQMEISFLVLMEDVLLHLINVDLFSHVPEDKLDVEMDHAEL
jgi:hypothetical protein